MIDGEGMLSQIQGRKIKIFCETLSGNIILKTIFLFATPILIMSSFPGQMKYQK